MKLYQKNRFLAFNLVAFILGQAFFTYKGVETIPFFHYGMYSEHMPPAIVPTYIIADGDTLNNKLPILSEAFILQNISYYKQHGQQAQPEITSPIIKKRFSNLSGRNYAKAHLSNLFSNTIFEKWLISYLEEVTGKKYTHIQY